MAISRFPGSRPEAVESKAAYAFGKVIRKYRIRAKYNQRALAERMGVNQNTICNWETDKRQPDAQTLRRLCLLLDIPPGELFGMEDKCSGLSAGEPRPLESSGSPRPSGQEDLDDPSIRYTDAEEAFMQSYRQLTPGHRYAVSCLTQTLLKVQQAEGGRPIRRLTLFERPLAAGVGDPEEFMDSGVPIYVYDESLTRRADCVFIVNGDSMQPDYPDGCRVLVKRISDSGELTPGDVGAFMIDNETYIKEYQPDGLHSRNPAYPVMRFSEYESVYLIGRVVGRLNKEDVACEEDVARCTAASGA